ncbi:DUF305 domain-containing protein [Amycolatopsis roodepoortensis]|uniref:DUF305 domain-containing protein n=1 Tax=Amycolatopsis roodepoortensis TaxID=700274 RepID=UPI00214BCADF|nr:DUF305 domain-containing protein [Amycolatopsis roodepoortensis]UUV35890.1 DUF305 domain-containing protein [Amycolatopsis roodepoortensis]
MATESPDVSDSTVDSEEAGTPETVGTRTGAKVFIGVVAALALLIAGATAGTLITRSEVEESTSPAVDAIDVGFAQDMSVHHLQAVSMSGIARERSTDAEVRTLAFDIESSQLRQIGNMQGWLQMWNKPTLPSGGYMAWMGNSGQHGSHGGMSGEAASAREGLMPGMATPQEIAKLRSLSGREFDVYFLQLMFRHHGGGAPMAQYAVERAGQNVVRTLADSIFRSQSAEMGSIKDMLASRGAAPLPQ